MPEWATVAQFKALQARVEKEEQRSKSADQGLGTQINAEEGKRYAGDGVLTERVASLTGELATALKRLELIEGYIRPEPTPAPSGLADTIGVNTHSNYGGTAYSSPGWTNCMEKMQWIGIKHIREPIIPPAVDKGSMEVQLKRWREWAKRGGKVNAIMGEAGRFGNLPELAPIIKQLVAEGVVETVEGTNEPDLNGGSGWQTKLVTHHKELKQLLGGVVPIVGAAMGNQGQTGPDISAYVDYGAIHSYPGGRPPSVNLQEDLNRVKAMVGLKPVFSTETGYHNATKTTNGHRPATEEQAGVWMPELIRVYAAAGIVRTFIYELVDQRPETALTDIEQHFGLFRNDWSPKPAAAALKALIAAS